MTSEFLTNFEKHVTVVVLGDYGRSPRMQYHTLSLLDKEFQVDVVAYKGSEPLKEITERGNIHLHYLKEPPEFLNNMHRKLQYIPKVIWQSIFLFWTLFKISKIDCIFLQNPPSIPTLPVCWFISCLRRCCLFVDFHNYGFTILGLSAGRESAFVKVAKWCEQFFSRKANKSLCVTKAMKEDLQTNWNVTASVFYDRSPDMFHSITTEEKHNFFMKMSKDYKQFQADNNENGNEVTRFSRKLEDVSELLPDRPALIVSSTSWTEDEDFSVLLSALEDYDKAAKVNGSSLPQLLVCITGKGPLKSYYEELIAEKQFSHVEILTLWLKIEDYPTILACADLGVSLHSSSSGLDLPMKVVDMFGCQLPVAAMSFNCIEELVRHEFSGTVFSTSQELSEQLKQLFKGFPDEYTNLKRFRKNLETYSTLSWEENWNHTVYPLFRELYEYKACRNSIS